MLQTIRCVCVCVWKVKIYINTYMTEGSRLEGLYLYKTRSLMTILIKPLPLHLSTKHILNQPISWKAPQNKGKYEK